MRAALKRLITALEQLQRQQQAVARLVTALEAYTAAIPEEPKETAAQRRARVRDEVRASLLQSSLEDVAAITSLAPVQAVLDYVREVYAPAFINQKSTQPNRNPKENHT